MATDSVEKSTSVEATLTAVKDGYIVLEIQKMGPWLDVHVGRDNVRMGTTMVPAGKLQVAFPVKGVKEGETINPEQLAQLITSSLEAWIPACLFFVNQANNEFGYEKSKEKSKEKPDDF